MKNVLQAILFKELLCFHTSSIILFYTPSVRRFQQVFNRFSTVVCVPHYFHFCDFLASDFFLVPSPSLHYLICNLSHVYKRGGIACLYNLCKIRRKKVFSGSLRRWCVGYALARAIPVLIMQKISLHGLVLYVTPGLKFSFPCENG